MMDILIILKTSLSVNFQSKVCSPLYYNQRLDYLHISELQIIHSRGDHWIVASTILSKPNSVDVHDSLIDPESHNIFLVLKRFVWLKYRNKKALMTDCGLFAIAYAVKLPKSIVQREYIFSITNTV